MTDQLAEAPPRATWHVAEAAEVRVQPTPAHDDLPVRDDALEVEADAMGARAVAPRQGGVMAWLDRTWGQALAFAAATLLVPFALSGQAGSTAAVVLVCALLTTGVALRALGVWRLRTRHGL